MVNNVWARTTLGALTQWLSGGTPSKDNASYWGGDIPWISAKSMGTTRIEDSTLRITVQGLAAGSRLAPKGCSLLLVRGSALHNTIPMGRAERAVAFNQDVKAIIAKKGLLPDYLYLWLLAKRPELRSMVSLTGIGAGKLDTGLLQAMELLLPPMRTQEAIAVIGKALDDKIELNRRMNETLEAMARALFKSWFVDFNPIKAKMEGRHPTGMDAETAALFPDKLVESELGLIPEGWKVGTLETLVAINPPEKMLKGTVAPYIEMKDLSADIATTANPIPRVFTSGSKFRNGDTLLARITPCLENGKTALVDSLDEKVIGWGSTEFVVIRPKARTPVTFPYLQARTDQFRTYAIQNMTGSSGRQRVPAEAISNYPLAVPSPAALAAFGKKSIPLLQRVTTLGCESATLSITRDTLLPQILSGKLSVTEAEKLLGDE